jgi:hypothetical protein
VLCANANVVMKSVRTTGVRRRCIGLLPKVEGV